MPMFQIQVEANNQKINTDLEADSKDDAIAFYRALSVAEVLQVKRYVYVNPNDFQKRDRKDGRYATVTIVFETGLETKIKIPDLKPSIDQKEIFNHIRSLYRNVSKIHVNITSR